VQSMPIRGIKMFHLGLGVPAKYRAYFRERLRQLPADADVLLSIGEIDCRPNEGIFYTAHKDAGRDLKALLEKTVADFVTYVHDEIRLSGAALRSVTLQGVPWPAYEIANRLPAGTDEATFFAFIDKVNEVMQREAQRAGWQFLDVKTPTGQNAGGGAPELRLDDIHLSPCFYDQADQWRRDVSGLGRDDVKLVSTSSHPSQAAEQSPTFLHVDCGQTRKAGTTPEFSRPTWKELRQDSDPGNQPDIIGSVVDMSRVPQGSVNAIFSKNDINRLYPQQVESVLQEFLRVLTPDGYLVISCPDLKSICALVAQDRLTEPVGRDEHGPLAPLDLIYGNRAKLSTGDQSAAFKCGFTANVLAGTLNAAGFQSIAGKVRDRAPFFDICLVASKQAMEDSEIKKLVGLHFPD